MSGLIAGLLGLVLAAGAAVVLTRDPLRQTVVASFFGLTTAVLFATLRAPDVALSEIVVGGVALPLLVLLTLAKIESLRQREEHGTGEGDGGRRE